MLSVTEIYLLSFLTLFVTVMLAWCRSYKTRNRELLAILKGQEGDILLLTKEIHLTNQIYTAVSRLDLTFASKANLDMKRFESTRGDVELNLYVNIDEKVWKTFNILAKHRNEI